MDKLKQHIVFVGLLIFAVSFVFSGGSFLLDSSTYQNPHTFSSAVPLPLMVLGLIGVLFIFIEKHRKLGLFLTAEAILWFLPVQYYDLFGNFFVLNSLAVLFLGIYLFFTTVKAVRIIGIILISIPVIIFLYMLVMGLLEGAAVLRSF